MKITPLQYAIFLYEITLKKHEIKKIIKDFLDVLEKNNDLRKIGEIVREFEVYEKKQRGVREVELISAKPLKRAVKSRISELIRSQGKAEIKESVDPDLLGGITLIIGDTMIDGSLRRKLRELNRVLSYGG